MKNSFNLPHKTDNGFDQFDFKSDSWERFLKSCSLAGELPPKSPRNDSANENLKPSTRFYGKIKVILLSPFKDLLNLYYFATILLTNRDQYISV
uniref:Uncharacterized protein n=1 Tax=Acrobeloides nanus TaxID=290746 RepID=A0A914CQ56_9BILA